MKIVKATLQDAKSVAAICSKAILGIYPRWYPQGAVSFFLDFHSEENIDKDIQAGKVFLYIEDDAAVATITVSEDELHRLFVLPEWRGRGCGTALLDFAERLVFEEHVAAKLESSMPAYAFYLKRGYEVTGFYSEQTASGDFLCWFTMEKVAFKA